MEICMTNGGIVTIDDADGWAANYRWNRHNGYARRTDYSTGERRTVYLHRDIAGAGVGDHVDHINGDRSDCRRVNLRVVPRAVNEYNKPGRGGKLRGVYLRAGRYRAYVGNVNLGTHDTPEAAHAAVLAELNNRAQGYAIPRA